MGIEFEEVKGIGDSLLVVRRKSRGRDGFWVEGRDERQLAAEA